MGNAALNARKVNAVFEKYGDVIHQNNGDFKIVFPEDSEIGAKLGFIAEDDAHPNKKLTATAMATVKAMNAAMGTHQYPTFETHKGRDGLTYMLFSEKDISRSTQYELQKEFSIIRRELGIGDKTFSLNDESKANADKLGLAKIPTIDHKNPDPDAPVVRGMTVVASTAKR